MLVIMSTSQTIQLWPLGAMARKLHVPSRWLRQQAENGTIPALKAGDRFVFDPAVVLPLVAEMARAGAGTGGRP
jgi:hypothetical protein